jgi:hypothetical protein
MNSSEMKSVAKELQSITVGSPTHFGGLTIFPLFRNGSAPAEPGYTLLEEAIDRGTVCVTELSAGGLVPELRFENLGEEPVLLLDGEELVGAKQNRALNLTILAPSKQVIVIPVSCVEAGRWHAESDTFRPAEHVIYARARAAKGAQVSLSMATSDSRRSDQSAIWDEIASKSERLAASSPTQAMNAMYDSKAVPLDAYQGAFAWAECQAGVVFAFGSETMGLDLMDHPYTMRTMLPKLVEAMLWMPSRRPTRLRWRLAERQNSSPASVIQSLLFDRRLAWGKMSGWLEKVFQVPLSGANTDIFTSARLLRMEPTAPSDSTRPLAARHAGARG